MDILGPDNKYKMWSVLSGAVTGFQPEGDKIFRKNYENRTN